ncbi:MAG: 2-phospho-L-lactate transferase [Candidatus Bathyarchaeota archaeon]|nr:2-phospho-L-lactate transferase [Candidatus Bathyarchaeota archaeon]
MITALAGGVGAAKLLTGLAKTVSQKDMVVIGNTGDDIELYGLHISPDLDIAAYSLAGVVDEAKGWGISGDTFHCLDELKRYTGFGWFNVGDRDLATHIYRTNLLRQGYTLTEVTQKICAALGVTAKILPMTDNKFETRITTKDGTMHFEEYMVKRGAKDEVLNVEFFGAETAKPAAGVTEAIAEAERVVVCPSNPVVSISTILSVKGIREALRETAAGVVGVSPIIGGLPVKGPADKLLRGLGREVSAFSVAEMYADFLDFFIIDRVDAAEKSRIEKLGVSVKVADIVMRSLEDKVRLANTVLQA